MDDPFITRLRLIPGNDYFKARIERITPTMAEQMSQTWWEEPWLDHTLAENEIDRHWDWHDLQIEHQDRILDSIGLAISVRDDVQGGMLISTVGVPSFLEPGEARSFLERLFTAPRNRAHLRIDRPKRDSLSIPASMYSGVGTALLRWGAAFSRELGFQGRLRLDSSPDFVDWYAERYFEILDIPLLFHEGIGYTPMELSPSGAQMLLG